MSGIDPASLVAPAPVAAPAPAAPAAFAGAGAPVPYAGAGGLPGLPRATDFSAASRPAPVSAGDDDEDAPAAPAAPVRPPVAPTVTGSPAPAAPFSLGGIGSDVGDRLSKATRGFLGNLALGPIGAIAGGVGALATGRETDPSAIAKEGSNATAQALLSNGASATDVAAAARNPTLMQALIQQYYGKDKFSVVQTGENDNGKQFSVFNTNDGTYKPIGGVATDQNERGVTVMGPNGKPITIPPGVNRKEFIKRVTEASADAATGKATEAQAKASSFAARMQQAEGILGGLQDQGLSLGNKAAGEIPIVGNYLQSADYQRYKQAASAFITAMLRQESGAAINKSEFDRYERELFPQPGDDASVVRQKAQQRAAAIQQMTRAAGPGYQAPAPGGTINVGGQAINWSVK
jgi:hypothetical protein